MNSLPPDRLNMSVFVWSVGSSDESIVARLQNRFDTLLKDAKSLFQVGYLAEDCLR